MNFIAFFKKKAGEIFILQSKSGEIIKKSMYGRKITSIKVSPDNKSFVAGDNNYKILLWSLSNYEVKLITQRE